MPWQQRLLQSQEDHRTLTLPVEVQWLLQGITPYQFLSPRGPLSPALSRILPIFFLRNFAFRLELVAQIKPIHQRMCSSMDCLRWIDSFLAHKLQYRPGHVQPEAHSIPFIRRVLEVNGIKYLPMP
jgi:hypothetical protein